MSILVYLIPWLLLVTALVMMILSQSFPLRSKGGLISVISLTLIMVLVSALANIATVKQNARIADLEAQIQQAEDWKYRHLDELTLILAQFKPPTEQDLALLKTLISYGWLGNNSKILRAKQAHESRERLRADYAPSDPMLIKGVPTSVDEHIVVGALKQVGFFIVPYQEGEEPLQDVNIIYYGRDMKPVEIKLAALTLIRAGVEVKAIKPFPEVTRGNLRAIRIDWNKYYDSRKAMEAADIETAESFN